MYHASRYDDDACIVAVLLADLRWNVHHFFGQQPQVIDPTDLFLCEHRERERKDAGDSSTIQNWIGLDCQQLEPQQRHKLRHWNLAFGICIHIGMRVGIYVCVHGGTNVNHRSTPLTANPFSALVRNCWAVMFVSSISRALLQAVTASLH